MKRVFFNWKEHFLPQLFEYIISEKNYHKGIFDFTNLCIVLPGKRALRRFTEIVALNSSSKIPNLIPPKLLTSSVLIEFLCQKTDIKLPTVNQRILCWARALEESIEVENENEDYFKKRDLANVYTRLKFAAELDSLHREVTAGDRLFSEIKDFVKDYHFTDRRWAILSELENLFFKNLAKLQLKNEAIFIRNYASLNQSQEMQFILAGIADSPPIVRNLIRKLSNTTTIITFAPSGYEGYFDNYGFLIKEKWLQEKIEISDDQLIAHKDVFEESTSLIAKLQEWSQQKSLPEISLCACDSQAMELFVSHITGAGLISSFPSGLQILSSEPAKFLLLFKTYLQEKSFKNLASLLRLPTFESYLSEKLNIDETHESLLGICDEYFTLHLQASTQKLVFHPLITPLTNEINSLFAQFMQQFLSLTEWARSTSHLLREIFGQKTLNLDFEPAYHLYTAVYEMLTLLSDLQYDFNSLNQEISALDALSFFNSLISKLTIPSFPHKNSLELTGWLDLAFDDSSCTLITNFQEDLVPEAINSHEYLPNSLRKALGLIDNDHRFARDIYLLKTILASKTQVCISYHQQKITGEPSEPSKLVYLTDAQTVARRISKKFIQATTEENKNLPPQTLAVLAESPLNFKEFTGELSITAFKDYLACPFSFYLKHVLKLRPIDDSAREISPVLFGNMLHQILKEFSSGDCKDSTDSQKISIALKEITHNLQNRLFGDNALPVVKINLLEIYQRLDSFAEWQSKRVQTGWEILLTEHQVSFSIEDIPIKGRIDRVDLNKLTNQIAIIDYKTGDKAATPDKMHFKNKDWIDLQLPLYAYIFENTASIDTSNFVKPSLLGYCSISGDKETAFNQANWDKALLESALEKAAWVVKQIKNNIFWPPAERSQYRNEFSSVVDLFRS